MKVLPIYSLFLIPAFVTLNTTSAAAEGSAGRFNSTVTGTGYIAWVNNMPDLDQNRDGLLEGGENYCGPTAASNILTFIANNGYPEVEPGLVDNAWEPVAEVAPGALRKRFRTCRVAARATNTGSAKSPVRCCRRWPTDGCSLLSSRRSAGLGHLLRAVNLRSLCCLLTCWSFGARLCPQATHASTKLTPTKLAHSRS